MKKTITVLLTTLILLICNFTINIENSFAMWGQTSGPVGGRIYCLTSSGTNIFAGTAGGVFLSTNNGSSWSMVNTGLTDLNIKTLVVSGTNIFAGTGDGVFLSINNGGSWTNIGLQSHPVYAIAVLGTNIFAGTLGYGVYKSTNNGNIWTAVNSGITNLQVSSLSISGTNIFAGTGDGIFYTTNNGTSWIDVNTGLTNQYITSIVISGANIFAGTAGGVFLSTNNGSSWTAVNNGLTDLWILSLTFSGTNLIAGTNTGGIFLSINNGLSWTAINTGLTDLTIYALNINGTNIFAGSSFGGVFLSNNNGTSWNAVNSGITISTVNSLILSGTNIFAGTDGAGVFLSPDNGSSWVAVNNGITSLYIRSLAVIGSNIFAGASGGVFKSTNNGSSWAAANIGLTNLNIKSFAVSGTNIFAGTFGGGVFLSTNNGNSWTNVSNGITNLTIFSLLVSGTNIFAGTSGGGIFLTTNNGSSWTAINAGLTNLNVSSLAITGSNIFAGTSGGGIFRSTNNGNSWIVVNNGITDYSIQSLITSGTNIIAGTRGGIFKSINNGASWTTYHEGFPFSPTVFSLLIVNNYIFSGTSSQSVWSRDLNDNMGQCLILGYTYKDLNSNGTKDNGEPIIPYVNLKLTSSSNIIYSTSSDQNGLFNLYVPIGNYTLSVPNSLLYYNQLPISYPITLTTVGQISGPNNFGFYPIPSQPDLVVSLTNNVDPRPGFDFAYNITINNIGTTTFNTGTVVMTFDNTKLTNVIAPGGTISGNTITWIYSNLTPGDIYLQTVSAKVLTTVPLSSIIQSSVTVNPISGDMTPYNNSSVLNNIVIGSYDPNDKNVDHPKFISPLEISRGDSLSYTIRFQNTGTASAINIYVLDTLSPTLNFATLQVISSSHPYNYLLRQDSTVIFYFNNINLADSNSNEPASHGFIKYRIKPRTNLALNDTIKNTAYIYFDYNDPIVTNTIFNVVGIPTGTGNQINEIPLVFKLYNNYPNPFNPVTKISYDLPKQGFVTLKIYDLLGREVRTLVNEVKAPGNYIVDFNGSELSSGIYFYKFETNGFSDIKKMMLIK